MGTTTIRFLSILLATALQAQLSAQISIAGKVEVDSADIKASASMVRVIIQNLDDPSMVFEPTFTDLNGRYEFHGLPSARYKISFPEVSAASALAFELPVKSLTRRMTTEYFKKLDFAALLPAEQAEFWTFFAYSPDKAYVELKGEPGVEARARMDVLLDKMGYNILYRIDALNLSKVLLQKPSSIKALPMPK